MKCILCAYGTVFYVSCDSLSFHCVVSLCSVVLYFFSVFHVFRDGVVCVSLLCELYVLCVVCIRYEVWALLFLFLYAELYILYCVVCVVFCMVCVFWSMQFVCCTYFLCMFYVVYTLCDVWCVCHVVCDIICAYFVT